jgi:hypothetical protein
MFCSSSSTRLLGHVLKHLTNTNRKKSTDILFQKKLRNAFQERKRRSLVARHSDAMDALVFSAAAWMFYDEHNHGVTAAVEADLEWDSPAQEETAAAAVMDGEVQELLKCWAAIDDPCMLAQSAEEATNLEQAMDALFATGPKHWQAMMAVVATKYSECLSFIRRAFYAAWPQLVDIHRLTPQVSTPVNNPSNPHMPERSSDKKSKDTRPSRQRKPCPDCLAEVCDMSKHKKSCKKTVVTRTLDVYMYFLAILLGTLRDYSDGYAELLFFLNTFVPQAPITVGALQLFLTAVYATNLLVIPHLYHEKARELAKTYAGDELRRNLRDWVYRDPLGVFFNNTHCALSFQYEVRKFLNPSGKSRE